MLRLFFFPLCWLLIVADVGGGGGLSLSDFLQHPQQLTKVFKGPPCPLEYMHVQKLTSAYIRTKRTDIYKTNREIQRNCNIYCRFAGGGGGHFSKMCFPRRADEGIPRTCKNLVCLHLIGYTMIPTIFICDSDAKSTMDAFKHIRDHF